MSKKFTIISLLFMFYSTWIFAGTTGKIAGKVVDAQTKEPLFGANVMILGTNMGASVKVDGNYFIMNVAPGTYTVVASMVGYSKVEQTQVVVNIDRTTQVDFQLSETSLLGKEQVVVAQRLAVQKDVSQSEVSATSEQINIVPLVQDLTQYMSYQSGVQITGDQESKEMLIRGGSGNQVGMVVDGLTMTNNNQGGPIDIVNLSAIKEVSIIKGGFNAEYGNIRSGLFNVVTKEGSQKYSGSADLRYAFAQQKHRGANLYSWDNYWVRPYVDPAVCWVGTQNGDWDAYTQGQYKKFEGWNAFTKRLNSDTDPTNDLSPEQARNLYLWQHALQGSSALGQPHEGSYGNKPDYNVDASFSGPVPFVSNSLGDLSFFASYRYNAEQYIYPAQLDAITTDNFMLKVNSQISSSMKFGIETMFGSQTLAGGSPGGRNTYFLFGTTPMDIYTRMIGLTFDHVLSQNTFYKVRISQVRVKNDANHARVFRDPTILASFGQYNVDEQPYGFLNRAGYVYAIADQQVIGGTGAEDLNQDEIKTINAKFDIQSQIGNYNQVQAGVELIFDDYNILEANEGFDPTGNTRSTWQKKPFRLQGYAQDKLEFEGFIANLGLRFDYNNPNTNWFGVDPYSRYFSRIYKYDIVNAPQDPAQNHLTVSPRLGISHPITENSKLFFNYGHFYNLASANTMFNINYGYSSSGILRLGNPNLLPQRTIAYELGYEQEIADMFLIRLTGYYKDVTNEIGNVQYVNYDESVNYRTYQNDQYADIRGFELEIRKDWGQWVSGWVNYTLMVATNGLIGRAINYQDPRKQVVYGLRNPIVEKPLPMPYANANVRIMTPENWGPTIAGYHIFDRLGLNFLLSWRTGEYLTWDPIPPFIEQNNLQWKSMWNVDLRISKFVKVDQFDLNLFLDILNVFDFNYLNGQGFANDSDFRDYMNSLHLPIYSQDKYKADPTFVAGNDKVGDVRSADKPYINMPNVDYLAWNQPRSVVFGIRLGF